MGEFTESIKNLRIRLEKSVEELKKLEVQGDIHAGEMAMWSVYDIWNDVIIIIEKWKDRKIKDILSKE